MPGKGRSSWKYLSRYVGGWLSGAGGYGLGMEGE